jgi:cobalt-zinc-cadmium efflux system outer membrane protein
MAQGHHGNSDRAGTAGLLALGLALALALVGAGPGWSAPADWPAAPRLTDYLDAAAAHPAVRRAELEAEARTDAARAAGALPDLKIAWGEMIVPVETRVGPQQRVFSISQTFPWFGSLDRRERAALGDAAAGAAAAGKARLDARRAVREAWYRLALLDEETGIVARNLEIVRQTEVFARAAYEAGSGRYENVLAAQMELGRLQSRLDGLRDRRGPTVTALNVAAGLDPALPGPAPRLPTAPDLADAVPPTAALADTLERRSPELAAARHREEGRRYAVEAAGRNGRPDLTVGLDYIMTGDALNPDMDDSGKDPVIARLGLSLPLWGGRADADRKAAAGRLQAAHAATADMRQELERKLENAHYQWRDAGRNLQLYEATLLPRARQSLDIVTANYETGRSTFADLMAAQQALLGLELAAARARADLALALNDLSALTGQTMRELAPALARAEALEPETTERQR